VSTYFRFVEENEHEGASWNFWLLSDGNEAELDRLVQFLDETNTEQYMVAEDELSGTEVDLLTRFTDDNYFPLHNRVDGVLSLPQELDEGFLEELYKGGIRTFFKAAS
jgi:hypothetical protein